MTNLYLIRQQLSTSLNAVAFLKMTELNNSKLNKVIELRIKEDLEKNSLQKVFHYQQKKQNLQNQIKMIKELISE